jgi:hypothetical protein
MTDASIDRESPTNKKPPDGLWRNLGGDHPQATEDGGSIGKERGKSKSLRKGPIARAECPGP